MNIQHRHIWMACLVICFPVAAFCVELHCEATAGSRYSRNRQVYVVGQHSQMYVRVVRDGMETYHGLPTGSPYGLKIQAGTMDGTTFHEEPFWTRQLALIHYVDAYRLRADSLYRRKGTPVDADGDESNLGEVYEFTFTVPDAGIPGKIWIRAVYEHPEFGHLISEPQYLTVRATQGENDTRIIWNSMIESARARSDAARVIALADSFLAIGYVDPDWAETAKAVAYEVRDYRKALEYLEANWEVNGVSSASHLSEWRGPRLPETERRVRDYERQRKDLLAKIGGK